MTTSTHSGRSGVPTPLFAMVGATDLAVERVRAAAANASGVQAQLEARVSAVQADVEKRITEFDPRALRSQAQVAPLRAAGRALEVAGMAESAYEELARRGRELVDRVRSQPGTQELVNQAGSTLSRGRAAITVARRAADETATSLLGTLGVGRQEAGAVVEETVVQTAVRTGTAARTTRTAARKTTTKARKRATATGSAAKGAGTSAARTAKKAGAAGRSAAAKVGD